jgi:outer membrane lipoprotein-sorting protein
MNRAGLLLAGLLLAGPAAADPAGDLLAAVDEVSNQGDDAHLILDVQTTDARGNPAERTLELWQKGDDKRLVKFTAPARLAGVGMLVPDGDTIYLYLPSYGRVRRVIGEARGDSFVGTDFAMEDLARISWAEDYVPELVEDHHLRLTPKDGADSSSARVDLHVRESDKLPASVEHYDDEGNLLRRIAFDDVREVDGRPLAHDIVVDDISRSRTTRATVQSAAFNRGLEDDLFTVNALSR